MMQLSLIEDQSKVERFFTLLYGNVMASSPRYTRHRISCKSSYDNDRQWIYIGGKTKMKSVATLSTLFSVLADQMVDTTYYTPNGYYRRDQRLTDTLRWLNAFVFDIDQPGVSVQDVFDRSVRAGLPLPTAIIRTPSGGVHVTYMFEQPVRATKKAIRLYTAIMSHMADDLGADKAAVGANRIFRTPSDDSLVYFEPEHRYSFDVFVDWREINHPYSQRSCNGIICTGDLINHPAIQYLLTTPCPVGRRDLTAYNLALAAKASGLSQSQAVSMLLDWYNSCCAKDHGCKPFTERDVMYKVAYVYRNAKYRAPKSSVIRELSGMAFKYLFKAKAKPRCDRQRTHLHEWADDLLALLQNEKVISGTQKEIAERLGCPITSFKSILSSLKNDGRIIVETKKGRNGITTIRLNVVHSTNDKDQNIQLQTRNKTTIIYIDFPNAVITKVVVTPQLSRDPRPPD